jgi:hydrogenase maturation protein HypF
MKCIHIHIEGQVQGVGFRPFVYRLAYELDIKGWVCNGVDGVHIEAEGISEQLQQFTDRLQLECPDIARITNFTVEERTVKHFTGFAITESTASGKPNLLITPDIGLCNDCRAEIHDRENPRYAYPFTTCTQCGPRFSIMQSLPYDRPTTSMNNFAMCSRCQEEYNNPLHRRYFSQTNSCPDCAIKAWLTDSKGGRIANSWAEAFPMLISGIEEGKIIAMKGVGGYLLLADATNYAAVQTLRDRKHRPTKPFALMYPDLETLMQDTVVSEEEAREVTSIQSPIVLLTLRDHPASGICTDVIAPGLNKIGAMLPYTAMFELLMHEWKKPIIATSANVSGSPILYKDEGALEALSSIADLFLIHNREIEIAQDDSVVQFSAKDKQRIVLRRSRGFAPTISYDAFSNETILAMGADMKSSFSLQANGRIYTSQYLGDLESLESQESYKKTLFHLLDLVKARPDRVIIDAHPQYYSAQLGRAQADEWNVPVSSVQHHKAHAYAVMAENDLLDTSEPVLSVIWDGTGYGDDGNIWGGEFFEYNEGELQRIGHINYAPAWQGDKMALDTRLSALFFGAGSERVLEIVKAQFSDLPWNYYSKLLRSKPDVYTSSAGRLFDAVACLTGVSNYNSFEGESAMRLEALAAQESTPVRYVVRWKDNLLDAENLLNQIALDMKESIRLEMIAYKFHAYMVDVIHSVVASKGYTRIALSGGVFQNALLVDLILKRLRGKKIFLHRELSPNDENISFGQLAYATSVMERITGREKEELILNAV